MLLSRCTPSYFANMGDEWLLVTSTNYEELMQKMRDHDHMKFGVFRTPVEWHNEMKHIPFPMDAGCSLCARLALQESGPTSIFSSGCGGEKESQEPPVCC